MVRLAVTCLVVVVAGGCCTPKSVDMDNLQERGGLWYLPNEVTPFTGHAVSVWDNSQKRSQGAYKDGKEHGTWTFWNEDGQKWFEGEFKDGKEHGTLTEWHENGQKSAEGEFKDGQRHGTGIGWYENGQKSAEVEFKDGQPHGTWTYWAVDGSLDRTETY